MEFRKELLLKGTVLHNNSVCVTEVWMEGVTNTLFCDFVIRLGNEEPFRLYYDENWNWCEEGNGETERADMIGHLIDRYTIGL